MKELAKKLRENGIVISMYGNRFSFTKGNYTRVHEVGDSVLKERTDSELESIFLRKLNEFLSELV